MKTGPLAVRHLLLAAALDKATAVRNVLNFMQANELIRYDRVSVNAEKTCSAEQSEFWEHVKAGMDLNRLRCQEFLSELRQESYSGIMDITAVLQGYLSKLLHTVAHLQDGFFGIDSAFYNLAEDSHQISQKVRRHIEQHPESHWVVEVRCVSYNQEDAFEALKKQLTGKKMSSYTA